MIQYIIRVMGEILRDAEMSFLCSSLNHFMHTCKLIVKVGQNIIKIKMQSSVQWLKLNMWVWADKKMWGFGQRGISSFLRGRRLCSLKHGYSAYFKSIRDALKLLFKTTDWQLKIQLSGNRIGELCLGGEWLLWNFSKCRFPFTCF